MSPLSTFVRSKTVFLRLVEGELQEGVECVGPSSSVSNVTLAETLATTAHAVVLLLPRGATSSGGDGALVQVQRKGDTKLRVRGRAPGSGSQESGGASKSSKASALLEFVSPSTEQCDRCWQALQDALYMCPHTTAICVFSYCSAVYMCPHTTAYRWWQALQDAVAPAPAVIGASAVAADTDAAGRRVSAARGATEVQQRCCSADTDAVGRGSAALAREEAAASWRVAAASEEAEASWTRVQRSVQGCLEASVGVREAMGQNGRLHASLHVEYAELVAKYLAVCANYRL
jgi:hypothetical protein